MPGELAIALPAPEVEAAIWSVDREIQQADEDAACLQAHAQAHRGAADGRIWHYSPADEVDGGRFKAGGRGYSENRRLTFPHPC